MTGKNALSSNRISMTVKGKYKRTLAGKIGPKESRLVTYATSAIRRMKTIEAVVEVQKFLVEKTLLDPSVKTHVFDIRLRTPEDSIPEYKETFTTLTDQQTGESRTTSTKRRVSS